MRKILSKKIRKLNKSDRRLLVECDMSHCGCSEALDAANFVTKGVVIVTLDYFHISKCGYYWDMQMSWDRKRLNGLKGASEKDCRFCLLDELLNF